MSINTNDYANQLIAGNECIKRERDEAIAEHRKHAASLIVERGLLRERLETAERTNAAQDDHINQQQTRIDWLEAANSGLGKALCAAKSEIARRDTAAGEPVGYIDPESMRKYRGVMAGGTWSPSQRGGEYNQTLPIYTATQPAVLPPKLSMDIDPEVQGEFRVHEAIRRKGFNQALDAALELGAQQQKVVELDNVFSINVAGVPVRVILLKDVSISLDVAGVKWEVKK